MVQPFSAASHHDILVLLVQITVLLLVARLMGELAQRLGQPTVVGEILAGIVLGPSLLSGIFPALGEWIIPQTAVQGYLLETISLLGVMFLLLVTGLEMDIPLIRSQARSAVGVAAGGLILPLAMGFGLGQFIPDHLLVDPEQRFVFALLLAASMAISAIPVVAKVLFDLNLTRRDVGQTIIAAAMIDDTTGWVILSIVIGLAGGSAVTAGSVLQSVGSVLAFLIISFTAGRWLVLRSFALVQNRLQMRDKTLSLLVFFMFAWGVLTQFLGLEALLGAFVIGVVFSQVPRLSTQVIHQVESIALGVFAPIFFAVAGLKVNALNLLTPELLTVTLVVIVVAVICKIVGVYAGARLIAGRDHWSALFFGAGLNARGSMGIIVAAIGLSLDMLTQDMFSIMVVMAMVTSLMAPFLLRWALSHMEPDAAEIQRLRQEELAAESLVANLHRVLVPVRLREISSASQLAEGRVLEKLQTHSDLSLTLMTVTDEEHQGPASEFLNKLSELFPLRAISRRVVVSKNPEEAILQEARREYDLMVLGASEEGPRHDVLFSPLVDNLVRLSPCPTMLVRGERLQPDWTPRRILVPSNGSLASRRAAELAFALAAAGPDGRVTILQVVEESSSSLHTDAGGTLLERQKAVARSSVESLRELGDLQGVPTRAEVLVGTAPEDIILDVARQRGLDLIILGTSVAVGTSQLHLGPRVERMLNNARCPVIVLNT